VLSYFIQVSAVACRYFRVDIKAISRNRLIQTTELMLVERRVTIVTFFQRDHLCRNPKQSSTRPVYAHLCMHFVTGNNVSSGADTILM